MKVLVPFLLALGVAACAAAPLSELSPADASSPEAPIAPAAYQPVMMGTASHLPVPVKSWREVNDRVAPRSGQSQ